MSYCAHTIRRTVTSTPTSITAPSLRRLAHQSQFRFTPNAYRAPVRQRARGYHSAHELQKSSGSGIVTVAIVVGIAIGGALLYPVAKNSAEEDFREEPTGNFSYSDYTDSFLVMAPNTPAGRPGTLTPDQEDKLRELWALTMKVFGVYEPASPPLNGSATPASPPQAEAIEEGGDKKKKKSRLSVFKRHKDKGQDSSESTATSGAATPSDISRLSLDDDDKHGQAKEFKDAIKNTPPEELRKAFWSMVKHDHPDALLLRFLRARKWDVEKALVMLISTMHWRAEEMHVDDDIMLRGELAALEDSKSDDPKVKKEGEDFLAQLRMGKSFLHGVDKEGRPMCVVRARLHRQGEQTEQSLERFTVYTIETARMLLRPPVDTATIVFDMTGFSMANMDYTPVKFMIKCFEANYPESLGAVLVYKAPWVFNAIWNIIRGWLDPVVAGKVHFAKTEHDLEAFVAKSQIPADLGGDEQWEYKYPEPEPNENALMADTGAKEALLNSRAELVKKYESTILNWIHSSEQAEEKAKSLEERRRERDSAAEDLRTNYWKLDPYVRARSLYDRLGVIGTGGKIEFYPSANKENTAPAAAAPAASAPETTADDLD